jgi:hypothetical protein
MTEISYDVAKLSVRDDLIAAHRHSWAHLARPGTWWSGARRLAIAAEVRNAPGCELCLRRKDALSPHAVEGSHDHSGDLPDNLVEVIHGVRNDAGRLTERWYDRVLADGLTDAEYVETVAIIATIVVMDTFARAIGVPVLALPVPVGGTSSRVRPDGARIDRSWVPTIAPEDATGPEADLYDRRMPSNIRRALTLVPDDYRAFMALYEAHYWPGDKMRDFDGEYRAISRAQLELLAGRVSALNRCAY